MQRVKYRTMILAIEICALLGYYAALNGNPLPIFQDNVLVPSSRVKKSKENRKPAGKHAVYIGKGAR
jgi:hypothetical protein